MATNDQLHSRLMIRIVILIFLCIPDVSISQPFAFPGAEGFGRYTTGGRGGRVYEVTNLNDDGVGSLRAAITASGPRTVVFRLSGTIALRSYLRIQHGDITIAGQTSPGDGICLRDYTVRIEANNVIVRYLRFRLGDSTKLADDAFDGFSGHPPYRNIIVDHCSISWALDENASFYDNAMFTMQWCFITESFYNSYHPKGNHGYGGMWGGWKTSFHHNLLAHNTSRNPRFNGSRYSGQPDSEVVDFRNNVIYNWGFNSAYGGEAGNQNIVANYYKYGPGTNTGVRSRILDPSDTAGNWCITGNYVYGNSTVTADNWNGGVQGANAAYQSTKRVLTPFPYDPVTTNTPEETYELVLSLGGATLPKRDTVDARIVQEVRTGTATYGGTWGAAKGIIDTQEDVGGWPLLSSAPAPVDSDHDGIPDEWELSNNLNPSDSTDGATSAPDGYSNLEHYLNSIVAQNPTVVQTSVPLPQQVSLQQNYPNPFNPSTRIEYALPFTCFVQLDVLNILGIVVGRLVDGKMEAGIHTLQFDGIDFNSGIYIIRLQAGNALITRKMVFLK